jgi:hypothetical protein
LKIAPKPIYNSPLSKLSEEMLSKAAFSGGGS